MNDAAHPVKFLDQRQQGKINILIFRYFKIVFRKMANEICFEAPEINMASE